MVIGDAHDGCISRDEAPFINFYHKLHATTIKWDALKSPHYCSSRSMPNVIYCVEDFPAYDEIAEMSSEVPSDTRDTRFADSQAGASSRHGDEFARYARGKRYWARRAHLSHWSTMRLRYRA